MEPIFNGFVVEGDIEADLKDDINRMFRQDFMYRPGEERRSERKHPSIQDKFAMEQIERSVRFDKESGHYSLGRSILPIIFVLSPKT